MTTAKRFWFVLGWALGNDCVAPGHALEVRDKVAGALRDCHPGKFADYVVGFIFGPNEMRDLVHVLADGLAWERSATAAIADGEEAFDAYVSHERAEGR